MKNNNVSRKDRLRSKRNWKNTADLVKYTQKYVNYSSKVYGQVWVVFDKEDYNDEQFNKVIENCEYMENLNKDGEASERNPMTKVYKIFDGLKEYLE